MRPVLRAMTPLLSPGRLASRVAIEESCTNSLVNIRTTGKISRAYSLKIIYPKYITDSSSFLQKTKMFSLTQVRIISTPGCCDAAGSPSLSEYCKCTQREFSCWSVRSGTLLRCKTCSSVCVLWDVKKKEEKKAGLLVISPQHSYTFICRGCSKKKQATFLWPFY